MLCHDFPEARMRAARAQYFEANGFGADGGYDDAWVDFKLGPLPFPFPNSASRVDAVKYHDLHHVLTGYDTSFLGELEISAWEIAAGCKRYPAAWVLNLGGLGFGVIRAPRRVFAAFVRGRSSDTLYGQPFDPLLDETVGETRARYIRAATSRGRVSDVLLFLGAAVLGLLVGVTLLALLVPLVPVGLLMTWMRRRQLGQGIAR